MPVPIRDERSVPVAVALPPAVRPYARSAANWRAGCEVSVLREGGQTYAAMLAAIAAAQKTIVFEVYILASDHTGDRFKAALIERARAGVSIRIIYDALGSFGISSTFVAELRDAGIHVLDYNPIAPWRRRWNLSHRDHRKILVIDDEIGFTGGLNIANDYAAVADGGVGWHDMHCGLRGPIVNDLARLFRRTWLRAGGELYPAPPSAGTVQSNARPPAHSAPPGGSGGIGGHAFVKLLANTKRRQRTSIRRAYLYVIRAAKTSIEIQNAYFLPDRGIRRALRSAVKRGVVVRIVVPGRSDVKMVQFAGLYVYRTLVRWGIQILAWRGPMMHAKTAVVDKLWTTIGSYNFDAMSRFNNLEATAEILDATTGTEMARQFDTDVALCDAWTLETWNKLAWWKKAFAWVCFRLRRFL